MTGLLPVARKRVRGFSLGMGQRLGIASALLGDPRFTDPRRARQRTGEGVVWVRNLVRFRAGEGRTVLVSSHVMSVMALTADHIIVIGRARVLADAPVADMVGRAAGTTVRVCSPQASRLAEPLAGPGVSIASTTRSGSRSPAAPPRQSARSPRPLSWCCTS